MAVFVDIKLMDAESTGLKLEPALDLKYPWGAGFTYHYVSLVLYSWPIMEA